jgi:hypothetical protein
MDRGMSHAPVYLEPHEFEAKFEVLLIKAIVRGEVGERSKHKLVETMACGLGRAIGQFYHPDTQCMSDMLELASLRMFEKAGKVLA